MNQSLRMFSSFLFDKGKITLEKLRDKHNVDASIEYVKLVYPDQYGRMQATQVHAGYFLQSQDKKWPDNCIKVQVNPFANDVIGTKIDFGAKETEQ